MNTPKPYQGDQPYIFISYPHKDSDVVLPIIAALQENGYRVWFDEGIELGRPWDDSIATHVRQCAVFVAMISPNYLASTNCCDELFFARECEKTFLLVYTEPVTLPDHMTMRYGRSQAIRLYDYPSAEPFCNKLFSTPELAPTRVDQEEPAYVGSSLATLAFDDLEAQLLELMRSDKQLTEKLLRSGNIRLTAAALNDGRHFVLRSPNGQVQLIITQEMTTIGRNAELQEFFGNDHYISRQHACLRVADSKLHLTNLSRNNGTYVNGIPVNESSFPLKEGDCITFSRPDSYPLIVSIE